MPEYSPTPPMPTFIKPQKSLIGGLLGLFLLHLTLVINEKNEAEKVAISSLSIPSIIEVSSIPLTNQEKHYFTRGEKTVAEKWRFNWKNKTGSMLIVYSRDFNMFHAPELCMAASGIAVDSMRTIYIGRNSFRLLSLNQGTATGIYVSVQVVFSKPCLNLKITPCTKCIKGLYGPFLS